MILYRSGLVTTATSFVVAASAAFLPDNSSLSSILKQNLDLFYVLGSSGLGLSLLLIHIYVSEIKRFIQALWVVGVLGSATAYFTLAQPANKNLILYVVDNPSAIWFVGPLFAALTGLVFKEGNASSNLSFPITNQIEKEAFSWFLKVILCSLNRTLLWQAWSWTSYVCYSYSSSGAFGIILFFLL